MGIAYAVAAILKEKGINYSVFTSWPWKLEEFTEIWIMGGDGTLNFFINQFPDVQLPLAVFPGGSGNDFHWMIYRDISVAQQVDLVLNGTPKLVDAGICNGRLFLNGVGIGFDGAIVRDLWGKKKLAGKASYLLSVLKHIVGYSEKPCSMEMTAETIKENCFMISVANSERYGGDFHVAPKASVTDGLLDINVIGIISPLKRMKYLPVVEKGEHLDLPFIKYRQDITIKITSVVKLHAHIDGEYVYTNTFDIQILPKRFSFIY